MISCFHCGSSERSASYYVQELGTERVAVNEGSVFIVR